MKYEVTKEQILEAHADACNEWKEKLEEWFPKVFEQKCEVGKWYWASEKAKREKTFLFYYSGNKRTYGFGHDKKWRNDLFVGDNPTGIEAKILQIEKALIDEAKKRYEVPQRIMYLDGRIDELLGYTLWYSDNTLGASGHNNDIVYQNGKWADINSELIMSKFPDPLVKVSKSDIAKLMNVEVSNLKIVD